MVQKKNKVFLLLLAGVTLGVVLYSGKAAAQSCVPPQVLIVLDKSSSMNNVSADGVTAKWDVAVDAIDIVTAQYEDSIDFGLMIFPYPDQCSPGEVMVDVDPYNSSAILGALGSPPPSGGNWTPMAQSLDAAGGYAPLSDPTKANFVLLITDGWQWCSPYDPATRFMPVDAVQGLTGLGITSYVVGFGDGVDALTLNRCAVAGGTSFPGCNETSSDPLNPDNCYFAADVTTPLTTALQDIVMEVTQEQCDGLDNDCDGLIDEGLYRPCETLCGAGEETCVNGNWHSCDAPQPETEICDGLDNDCDGIVDEGCECVDGDSRPCGQNQGACQKGVQVCANGSWGNCTGGVSPSAEICDNLDNDCDGLTDESLYRSCGTACGTGQEICNNGSWMGCTAPEPSTEICDNIDNDCDGSTDEGLSRSCQTPCGTGTETCTSGQWGGCTAQFPENEICDDLDNDCDGVTDEGCACNEGDTRPCGDTAGACESGTQVCVDNAWSGCQGAVEAQPEICDDIDNDCDGSTDEDLIQPCQTACGMGEEVCVNGDWHGCTARQPSGEVCDGEDNDCNGIIDDGDGLCGINGVCVGGVCQPKDGADAGTGDPEDAGGPGVTADTADACGCRTLGDSSHLPRGGLILLLAGLALLGFRRRR